MFAKNIILVILSFLLLSLLSSAVFAVSINITDAPSIITTEEFQVKVDIAGPNPGPNYLRIDLYREGSTSYFGETFNGQSWSTGSDGHQYFPVTVSSEGTASAQLTGRLGQPPVSEYPGPGHFKLRIRRYTSSGNPASNDVQTPANVQITASIFSPTQSPAPTVAPPTSTSTAFPSNPPTSKPTRPPSPSPSQAISPIVSSFSTLTPSPSPPVQVQGVSTTRPKSFFSPLIFVLPGVGLLVVAAAWIVKDYLHPKPVE